MPSGWYHPGRDWRDGAKRLDDDRVTHRVGNVTWYTGGAAQGDNGRHEGRVIPTPNGMHALAEND